MKRLVFFYIFLVAAIVLGLYIQKDPGYLLLSFGHWTLETPLWFALVIVLLCFFIVYILLGTLKKVSTFGGLWHRFRMRLAKRRSYYQTKVGLIAFIEGKWDDAEAHSLKALSGSRNPLLNYLVLARAADAQGHSAERDKYLNRITQMMPDAALAIGLTRATLQLESNQLEQALATLSNLHQQAPKHPKVLALLLKLYLELNDWKALQILLPQLKRHSDIDQDTLMKIQLKTSLGLLQFVSKDNNLDHLYECYNEIPKTLRHNAAIVSCYVNYLLEKNDITTAESTLRHTLKKEWNDDLILLFSQIKSENPNKQLQFVEHFLNHHPENPSLLLALGKLTYSLQLWGKSKNYLEKSAALLETPDTYFILGNLLQTLNEDEEAEVSFKKGLSLVIK